MKTYVKFACLFLILAFMASCGQSTTSSGGGSGSSLTLTHKSTISITPTDTHKTGVFIRIFYNSARNKFYVLFQGIRKDAQGTTPNDSDYCWREYDTDLQPTGNGGTVEVWCNGDYAVAYVNDYYYYLQAYQSCYRLNKLNSDFKLVTYITIPWDISWEAGNDQLMNYTNDKLYLATLYDTQGTGTNYYTGMGDGHTYPRMFTCDLSPTLESSRYLSDEVNVPSGGSIIFFNGIFNMVTCNQMRENKLYAYQWDTDWKYLGKKLISDNGQWSQGLLYDNGKFYVAYHTGVHTSGNLALGVYDTSWDLITKEVVTNFSSSLNAQRPWIIKIGNKLYLSYDIDSYDTVTRSEGRSWQGSVEVYEVRE